ncbi:hypothetical protein P691DRAFT_785426 [Macrolepiota fuliginosa MF-IS2]|uniref:Uncharacterized protein n=1 Tax=Macrolepiota fuliginosa MF-IS2 TaxID=1400762 RepID=A0A9P5XMX9_9AGAR|nr:hypothetical protein P691DRAFT_785426 [Macrolepiota fuliginosa MF-IS2]
MTRLLPRLARIIEAQPDSKLLPFDLRDHRPRRPKSLHKPFLSRPSFNPDAHPQSILLESENPIATPDKYVRHKTLPPRVYVPETALKREGEHDGPRQMTEEERKWWSSPYRKLRILHTVRMLTTPPRKCALSGHLFPSAFLLRLAPMRTSDAEPTSKAGPAKCMLVPDGLQNLKFTARQSNRAVHVLCSRQAISLIHENRLKVGNIPHYVTVPPNLDTHVSHILRLCVLQTLELLVQVLQSKRKADILANPPIRRLSMKEWKDVQEKNQIPWKDAVAIIHAPPVSDEIEPSMSPLPLPLDADIEANASRPVATMCDLPFDSSLPTNFAYRDVLPSAKVPLYEAASLFPHAAQRAVLHRLLLQAQSLYGAAHRKQEGSMMRRRRNPSDAYVLSSNSEIIKLGDVAEMAMALWRVFLYERDLLRE